MPAAIFAYQRLNEILAFHHNNVLLMGVVVYFVSSLLTERRILNTKLNKILIKSGI
jgi:hypothetical protein